MGDLLQFERGSLDYKEMTTATYVPEELPLLGGVQEEELLRQLEE